MLIKNGNIQLLDYHIERLFSSAAQLLLQLPKLWSPDWLEQQILDTARKNKLEHLARVRLQLFAGGGGLFGTDVAKPGFLIECFPIQEELLQLNENGLIAGIATGLNKSADRLSNLKTCNALIYAMAARQAKTEKWNDALILNTQGNVIESTIANIYWVTGGKVYTPPLSEGCIAGVMRRHIITLNPEIIEKTLSVTELMQADEVLLTNAIRGIKWIGSIGDKTYTNTTTKKLKR